MTLDKIDKMIEEAEYRRNLCRSLMYQYQKENDPEAFSYAISVMRYLKIIKRLQQSRLNYI